MNEEEAAEAAWKARFLGVTIRDEVNSITEPRNCSIEVNQLLERRNQCNRVWTYSNRLLAQLRNQAR